eukprot:Pgem_evm1s17342
MVFCIFVCVSVGLSLTVFVISWKLTGYGCCACCCENNVDDQTYDLYSRYINEYYSDCINNNFNNNNNDNDNDNDNNNIRTSNYSTFRNTLRGGFFRESETSLIPQQRQRQRQRQRQQQRINQLLYFLNQYELESPLTDARREELIALYTAQYGTNVLNDSLERHRIRIQQVESGCAPPPYEP